MNNSDTSIFSPGDRVVYTPDHGGSCQEGTVTSVNDHFVFVCYGLSGSTSMATRARQLKRIEWDVSRK